METRFEVKKLDNTETQDVVGLFQALLVNQAEMKTGVPRYLPLITIINHVHQLGARCAIIEKDVQDPDFVAEYSTYYSRWSFSVPRYCNRIHFFNIEPSADDPLEVIDHMASVKNSYLGFVTLRPISISPIGATILRPKPGAHFILSRDNFPVNITGREFAVMGTPFMQQDNAVGACAQASIWMALRTLRRKEGLSAFSTAQITNAATRFIVQGRTLPNRQGLIVEQIAEAVRSAGYAPHLIPLRDIDKSADQQSLNQAKQALYPYIESGIPVLLILHKPGQVGHAVVLIGHGWTANPSRFIINKLNLKNEPELGSADNNLVHPIDASSWIEPLYIHNDNTGPYLPLPEASSEFGYSLSDAVIAIPFLQTDVFIDGSEAAFISLVLFNNALAISDDGNFKVPSLVTRTYLQERAEFRKSVFYSGMPDDIKSYYRKKWLPKRFWLTEINLMENYGNSPNEHPLRVGEILVDPASDPEDGHFLSIHLGADLLPPQENPRGVMIDRNAFDGAIEAFEVSVGKYAPLVRKR